MLSWRIPPLSTRLSFEFFTFDIIAWTFSMKQLNSPQSVLSILSDWNFSMSILRERSASPLERSCVMYVRVISGLRSLLYIITKTFRSTKRRTSASGIAALMKNSLNVSSLLTMQYHPTSGSGHMA